MDDHKKITKNVSKIAHLISDSEDESLDEDKTMKEMEKLTETEIQKKTLQLRKELKRCRRKVRSRLERKLGDVKSSDMVGLLRRLKAKIRILETVKKNRIREL